MRAVRRMGGSLLAALWVAVTAPPLANASEGPLAMAGFSGITVRVEGENWGSAARDEVETVLNAVAAELTGGAPAGLPGPIVVSYVPGSPVTLFDKGEEGEYRVRLSARNRGWAQYAYQFGHELCHVLSNYEARARDEARRRTQWFEESLCEAAGLFVLRRMAVRWRTEAPYPGWEAYASHLSSYADQLLAEPHRHLPPGMSAADWLQSALPALAADPYRRDDNEVVANVLLPLFERASVPWRALRYLNLGQASAADDIAGYVRQWHSDTPAEHRPFVDAVASMLGLPPG